VNTTTQTESPVELLAVEAAELTLRTLDSAEMIQVGGGYCAADY